MSHFKPMSRMGVHEQSKKFYMIPSYHYLILSALGQICLSTLNEIIRAATQAGCNILNTQVKTLGKETSLHLYLSGNWGAIAKIETLLPSLEKRLDLQLHARRTLEIRHPELQLPYSIQITALDKPGILAGLSEFLSGFEIILEEISAHTFLTHTHTRMSQLTFNILISDKVHLASFREQFLNYCESKNLDAILEPRTQCH